MDAASLDILNKIRSGEMTVEEGARRLELLEAGPGEPGAQPQAETTSPGEGSYAGENETIVGQPEEPIQPDLGWWKNAWWIVFSAGSGIVVLAAMFMGWAYSSQHMFWFTCSWLPMLLGLLVFFLGWWSRTARWVHVRVHGNDGGHVTISMPLPLRLAAWALRFLSPFIPKLREQNLEGLPDIFNALADTEGPLSVEVDDEDGSQVRVYIL